MQPTPKPSRILIPDPPMGGKPFCLREKGIFVLEEGPGMLQICNITHAGSGELLLIDGVPNETGYFPDDNIAPTDPKWGQHNGRVFAQWSPVYMGAWMMNAGFRHGLTVVSLGGDLPPFATLVWIAQKTKEQSVLPVTRPQPVAIDQKKVIDLKTPAGKGSLMRSVMISELGLYRIARRTAEMYSVLITHSGSFCGMRILNGLQHVLFDMFSTFTGSFVLSSWAEEGIIIDITGRQQAPLLQLNWREKDLALV